MPAHGFPATEKAQCVLLIAQGYGYTALQRLFRTRYHKDPSGRSKIREWYNDYRTRGSHADRGGNARPQASDDKKEEIRA